jgi:hypothetical protein
LRMMPGDRRSVSSGAASRMDAYFLPFTLSDPTSICLRSVSDVVNSRAALKGPSTNPYGVRLTPSRKQSAINTCSPLAGRKGSQADANTAMLDYDLVVPYTSFFDFHAHHRPLHTLWVGYMDRWVRPGNAKYRRYLVGQNT